MTHPGTETCYRQGCREAPCVLAHSDRMSGYRASRRERTDVSDFIDTIGEVLNDR